MYSISSFGLMINDKGRMQPYVEALKKAIKPDSIVLDIGTGTGIFAILACQFGARKVLAIEPSNAIHLAKEIAKNNGYEDKIDFIQNLSTEIDLPEKVNIIISDLRGVLPFFSSHIDSIIDARKRFLLPNGILIPQQDLIYGSIISSAEIEQEYLCPWQKNDYEINMKSALKYIKNSWTKAYIKEEELLFKPQLLGKLNYREIEEVNWQTKFNFKVEKENIAHGICLWFDTILGENIGFSNAPLSNLTNNNRQQLIYGQSFFPWQNPVELMIGDSIEITMKANLINEEYIWRWQTKITDKNNTLKINFNQSSLLQKPLSIKQLNKQSATYKPSLNWQGKATKLTLELMEKDTDLEQISLVLLNQFPEHFITKEKALSFSGQISQIYSN